MHKNPKHEQKYSQLCAEIESLINSSARNEVMATIEKVRQQDAYHQLTEIRLLQKSGLSAEQIISAIEQRAVNQLFPKTFAAMPEI